MSRDEQPGSYILLITIGAAGIALLGICCLAGGFIFGAFGGA